MSTRGTVDQVNSLDFDTSKRNSSSHNDDNENMPIKILKTATQYEDCYTEKRNNRIKWIIAIVSCVVNFLYGCSTHGITGIVAVHLERRYSYESVYTGIIMTGNDAAAIVLGPLIGHYCSKKYCGRWMGFGALIVGFGCLLFTLPHSMSHKYTPSYIQTNYTNLCSTKHVEYCNFTANTYSNMPSLEISPKLTISIFYAGQLIMGVGGILVDILSLIFIDDSFASTKNSGVMALWYISRYAGPLLGLVVGSASLRKWIDMPSIPLVDVDNPAWLGAWWLSYRIIGGTLLILGVLLLTLSNSFSIVFKFKCTSLRSLGSKYLNISSPNENIDCENDSKLSVEIFSNNHISLLASANSKNAKFLNSLRRIILNPAFVLSVFGQITTCTVMVGVVSFLPKILLIVFDVPPSKSGFTLAFAGGGAAILGVFFTSNLIKYFEMKKKLHKIIILCMAASIFITMQGTIYWTRIGCEDLNVIGHTTMDFNNLTYIKSTCAPECTCPSLFDPMCDGNGNTYFSPCTAGCRKVEGEENIFLNCSCLAAQNDPFTTNETYTPIQNANKPYMGTCKRKCSYYIMFIIIIASLSFLGVASSASQNSVILRCVDSMDRALALSIQFSFIKIMCYVPSPIIFGSIIDVSCSDWVHIGHLDSQYHCYHAVEKVCMKYDIKALKTSFGSISVSFGMAGTILYMIAYRISKSRLYPTIVNSGNIPENAQLISS